MSGMKFYYPNSLLFIVKSKKNKMLKSLFFIALFLMLLLLPLDVSVSADQSAINEAVCRTDKEACRSLQHMQTFFQQKTHPIGGEEYTRDQLVIDFIQVAFSKSIWQETTPFRNIHERFFLHFYQREHKKDNLIGVVKNTPWAHEFVFRDLGHPKFDGLNKWTVDKIEIAFGWPPALGTLQNWEPSEQNHHRYQSIIKPHIVASITKIENAIDIPISMIERKKETTNDFARLRIILYDDASAKNYFKMEPDQRKTFVHPVTAIGNFQKYLVDAVRFTPVSRSQVDGYFLTDKDNNIQLAICLLNSKNDDALLKSLTTECLLRAMGLPEVSRLSKTSTLSNWNRAYDPYSRRYILDGSLLLDTIPTEKPMLPDVVTKRDARKTSVKEDNRNTDVQVYSDMASSHVIQEITEYDLALLRTLYCKSLVPSMSRYEVLTTLYNSDNCFKKFKGAIDNE